MLNTKDHGAVREICISRPPANAINPELIEALIDALETAAVEADAVVVSGLPGMFSAGLDVPALLQLERPQLAQFWQRFNDALKTIALMPVPTAFALTGHAPAGGIVLALFADYRVMAEGKFKTGLNEVQVGLVVSSVIHQALVRAIGPRPAEKILVPGAMLGAAEALDIGLVDELQPTPEAVVERCVAWCQDLLQLPRNAMSLTRQMARADMHGLFDEPDKDLLENFSDLWFSDVTQETLHGLVARLQKK